FVDDPSLVEPGGMLVHKTTPVKFVKNGPNHWVYSDGSENTGFALPWSDEDVKTSISNEKDDWEYVPPEVPEISQEEAEEIVNDLINTPSVGDPADHPVGSILTFSYGPEGSVQRYRKDGDNEWYAINEEGTASGYLRTDQWMKESIDTAEPDEAISLQLPEDPDDTTPDSGFSIGDIVVSTKNK